MVQEGEAAPDFEIADDAGRRLRLSELRGRKVVIFFYPKDDTPGCTQEAVAFSALMPAFAEAGAQVIGISPDSCASHAKFKAKHGLAMALGADPDKGTLQAYGVWVQKSMYGRTYMGVERTTVLVDAAGRIARIWRKVKVKGHAEAVLQAVLASG